MEAISLRSPPRSRWLTVGLALVFLALSVQYAFKVKDDRRSAFVRWRPQIRDLTAGVNVYERHNYPNPPIMGLLLSPLALLPPLAGALAWFFVKALLAVVAIHWALALVESGGKPLPAWARLLAVLIGLRPLIGDLTHGNVNLFILFLVIGALHLYCRRRQGAAGLLLALAIACKVTPALFLPYFAWKRAWRTLAGCGAGLVLFLGVAPAIWLGPATNAELLASWADRMVVPYVLGRHVTTEHQNQSLPGVSYRLLTRTASFSEFQEQRYVPTAYHNLLDLPPGLVQGLLRGLMAGFALLVVWCCRTPADGGRRWRLAAEFSVVLLGMLVFSERTWKHHYVPLILPIAVLLYELSVGRPGRRLGAYLAATLALVVLLLTATGSGLPGVSERMGKLGEVYGAYLWANLLLLAALVVLLHRKPFTAAAYEVVADRVAVARPGWRWRGPELGPTTSAEPAPLSKLL